MIFFFTCLLPETLFRIVYELVFLTNDGEEMKKRSLILKALVGAMYAIFTIYVLKTFETFTPHCYDPYPSLSLVIFGIILLCTLP